MNMHDVSQLRLINNESVMTRNICFVNSVIQMMKRTEIFQFILTNVNTLPHDKKEVCHAINDMLVGSYAKEKSAGVIRKLVASKTNKAYLANQSQQDPEEFMRLLIDVICMELHDNEEFNVVMNKHWGEEKVMKVFLDNLPLGSCFRCNQLPSCRIERFLFLKLIVPSMAKNVNLSTLIESYYSASSDILRMKCSNCCHHEKCPQTGFCNSEATSKTELLKLPDYLLITLLRFGESMQGTKVNT